MRKAKNPSDEAAGCKLESFRIQLKEELDKMSEIWCRRSKANWIEKGERSTKYFYARYKARKSMGCQDKIKPPENRRHERDTLLYIRDFYEKLYKAEEIDMEAVNKITNNLPQVSEEWNHALTRQIERAEILQAIQELPGNKSPGTDGLTYEFYKILVEKLAPILEVVFNNVIKEGRMPSSWHKNILILIPKKEENLEDIGNWRPISLVNSDAKIFMKIMAGRLNIICKEIIANHQNGFVAGRLITDSVLDIITTMRAKREVSEEHWLVLIDQAKAFDRVNHVYMSKVLERMNFSNAFIRVVVNLFANQEAHIVGTNEISKPFRVGRGVRQGDPLSPLLFVIAFEPLLIQIKDQIRGLPLGNSYFKLAAYADDLTIGLGSSLDWEVLTKLLRTYEAASNARINKRKTKLIPLTPIAERVELKEEGEFVKCKEDDSLLILGHEVKRDGSPVKGFWAKKIEEVKRLIEKFGKRNLSFKGKILVINSMILSRIWYSAYICPPNRKQLAEINDQLSFWIKQKSRMLPKYSTFQKSYEDLGLKAPILRDLLDTRLIMVWKGLVTKNCTWASALRDIITKELREKRDISPLQALNINPVKLKAWPNEWKPYIRAWGRVKGRILARSNWPWEENEIMIDQWIGKQISTKRVIEILRSGKKSGIESSEQKENHIPT